MSSGIPRRVVEEDAAVDETSQRVSYASREAWRWLGWRVMDPKTGRLRILPYESLGSL